MSRVIYKTWWGLLLPLMFSFNCAISQIIINFGYENFKYKAALNPDFVKFVKMDTVKFPQLNITSIGMGLIVNRKYWRFSMSVNLGYNFRDREDIKINTTFPELNIELGPKFLALLFGIRRQNWFNIKIPGYPKDASLVYPKNITVYQSFIGVSTGVDEDEHLLILSVSIGFNFYSKNRIAKFSRDVIPVFSYIDLPKNSIKVTLSMTTKRIEKID